MSYTGAGYFARVKDGEIVGLLGVSGEYDTEAHGEATGEVLVWLPRENVDAVRMEPQGFTVDTSGPFWRVVPK